MDKFEHINDVTGKPYDTPDTISIPVWVKNGMMKVRRDGLNPDDPEQTYHYCKRVLNVRPENYGVQHPRVEEFGGKTREELIDEILQLLDECIGWQMYG